MRSQQIINGKEVLSTAKAIRVLEIQKRKIQKIIESFDASIAILKIKNKKINRKSKQSE